MSFYKEVPGRQTTLESTLKFDIEPKAGSTNPVTSEGVKSAIDGAVGDAAAAIQEQIDEIAEKAGSGYTPKGEASVATLNGLTGQENGELYTMTDSGTLTGGSLAVVAGDTVAWDATNEVWYKAMDYAPRQYGTNEVHNLPTTITSFRTGDVIPVDGPDGTAKMSKDDLLRVTAENENLIRSKGYIYNDATAIAAFGDSKSVDNAKNNTIYEIVASYVTGLPTGAGNGQLMTYMGVDAGGIANVQIYVDSVNNVPNMYVRKKLAGTFTEWKKVAYEDGTLIHSKSFLSTEAKVIAEFGSSKDVANAKANTIYALDTTLCVGLPDDVDSGADLFTYCGETSIDTNVQILVSNQGKVYTRIKWVSAYTAWKRLAFEDGTLIHTKSFLSTEAKVIAEFGAGKDVKDAKANTIYALDTTLCVGLPDVGTHSGGDLFTYCGDTTIDTNVQIFVTNHGVPYTRIKWGGSAYTAWKRLVPDYDWDYVVRSSGFILTATDAENAFGVGADVGNADPSTIYSLNKSVCNGLPTFARAGTLVTLRGITTSTDANFQLYIDYIGDVYIRTKWAGSPYIEWKNLTRGVSHIIPQFLKIGFVGDSVSSGASEYKDSDGNYHCVDNPEYSQVQCWGRERGVTALNLSQGGMTTRNWFTREKGYTRATTPGNECKCYFIMLGGNDIGEYHDLQDIGSTADVHVGNENLNADTYYGNYSKIIATLKSAGGKFTKIFAFTYPTIVNSSPYLAYYNSATREICALYDDVYVIELENDPIVNGDQVRAEKYRGHFSAHGYKLMADRMEYLVDMYVEEHGSNFENIQFIGTNLDVQEWMS